MAAPDGDPFELLDQLAEEFAQRYRQGERPSLQEYIDRHPDLADEIRATFRALVQIEQVESDQSRVLGESRAAPLPPLLRVGDYQIIREIGRGGMGVVYEAEQVSLGRRVALKILPLHASRDDTALERFRREARSAARLHHTNIVPVFEVGQDGETCYYAMQFIRGQGLDQVIVELARLKSIRTPGHTEHVLDSPARLLLTGQFADPLPSIHPPSPTRLDDLQAIEPPGPAIVGGDAGTDHEARLPGSSGLSAVQPNQRTYVQSVARIGLQVAQALAYAHARGIIHRDVKPSNLLLDSSGVVWITDFGLAKTEEEALTGTGDCMGTVRYMSPERFRGMCDARADVYALGLTLYELLVLRPAFDSPDRLRLAELIAHQEPARPRRLAPYLPRDLETIVLKAIAKDPNRRYPTAQALAEDLRRFLDDEPIQARREPLERRLLRWVRRHPATALSLALVALMLVAGTAVGWYLAWQADASKRQAQAGELRERTAREGAEQARDEARTARQEARQALYYTHLNLASQAADAPGGTGRVQELLDLARPEDSEPDRRDWEWYYLRGLGRQALLTLHRHDEEVRAVSWSPDGRRLASGGDDRTLRIWDAATGRELAVLPAHVAAVTAVSWSPDGKRLASAGGGNDATVRVWDPDTGQELLALHGNRGPVTALAWSPDGSLVLSGGEDGTVRGWDAATGRGAGEMPASTRPVRAVAWSPAGGRMASAGDDGLVKLWKTDDASLLAVLSGHGAGVEAVCWSPDGKRLASLDRAGDLRLWDAVSGECTGFWRAHQLPGRTLAFRPDGRVLASGGADGTVKLWDAETRSERATFRGHTRDVTALSWSPDGKRLVSASADHTLKVWDAGRAPDDTPLDGPGVPVAALRWHPYGRLLAGARDDGTIRIWDTTARREAATLRGHADGVRALCWSPDGTRLASAGTDRTLRTWDVATGEQLAKRDTGRYLLDCLAWSPDGTRLAAGGQDHLVHLWEPEELRETASWRGHSYRVNQVAWSPDGRTLASAGEDRTLIVWDAEGRERATLRGHTAAPRGLCWSPDGKRLASTGDDATVRVWEIAGGREALVLRGHTGAVRDVSWAPNGRRLATGGMDSTIKIWDVVDGQEAATLRGHAVGVTAARWSPDGYRLASAGGDGVVGMWDAWPGYELERSPHLLPELDRRLQAEADRGPDLLLRAEVRAGRQQWDAAAADWTAAASPAPWFAAGWWVAGPLPDSPSASEERSAPSPLQPIVVAGRTTPVGWRPLAPSAEGCLDLGKLLVRAEPAVVLALLRVYSPREQPAAARIGYTGTLRCWRNGQIVFEDRQGRLRGQPPAALHVFLRAGWNDLLFQVHVSSDTDRFCVDLSAEPADRVLVLLDQGRDEEARILVQAALRAGPDEARWLRRAVEVARRRAAELHRRGDGAWDAAMGEAIAAQQKLLDKYPGHPGEALVLADLYLERADRWQVLVPTELHATGGAALRQEPDGSIAAGGPSPDRATYRLVAPADPRGVAVLRLETLPDPRLPEGGSGRYPANGNFLLSEVRLKTRVGTEDTPQAFPLSGAWTDFEGNQKAITEVLDGNPATAWETWPLQSRPHVALFFPREPLPAAPDRQLVVELDFQSPYWPQSTLGRFRLSTLPARPALTLDQWRRYFVAHAVDPFTRLGVAAHLAGDDATAVQTLSRAVERRGGETLLNYLVLMRAYARMLRGREARDWWDRALARMKDARLDTELRPFAVEALSATLDVPTTEAERRLREEVDASELAALSRPLAANPDDAEALRARGEWYGRHGRWAEARADLLRALNLRPDDHALWYHTVALLAEARDEKEYRRVCHAMLERVGATHHVTIAERTAKGCLLLPVPGTDLAAAAWLAETAVMNGTGDPLAGWYHLAHGLAEYRQGRYDEAVRILNRGLELNEPPDDFLTIKATFVLALCRQGQGSHVEARRLFDRAKQLLERQVLTEAWPDLVMARVLQREAEEALGKDR